MLAFLRAHPMLMERNENMDVLKRKLTFIGGTRGKDYLIPITLCSML
jgi:hypothetical protein